LLNTLADVQIEVRDPVAGLKSIANAFVDLVYATESIQLYRLIIAEQQQFPDLGELIYRSGPEPVLRQLSSYLAELNARYILNITDIETSSRLFLDMLKGDQHFRCLLGLQPGLDEVTKQRLIDAAISLFIKGHRHAA
jgi:TetR/AcrR family transcriptional repressor of mexJK operon